jgi:hypothetical protein
MADETTVGEVLMRYHQKEVERLRTLLERDLVTAERYTLTALLVSHKSAVRALGGVVPPQPTRRAAKR